MHLFFGRCADLQPGQPFVDTLCSHQLVAMQDDPAGAFLVNVAVHQRFRGQGIGRMLISAAVKTAAQRAMAKRLYTHVDCDNDAAWRLYQQHGFDIHDEAACSLPGAHTHLAITYESASHSLICMIQQILSK
jgi:ribosomal protein S18 acetylase RimI-like enzyme